MRRDERDLLDVLKAELEFLETGGYAQSPKSQWRPRYIFEDSPSCMNQDTAESRGPCSACVLMHLVPTEFRGTRIPCRHIPLSSRGETLDSMYRYDDQRRIEETVGTWLHETIRGLEHQRNVSKAPRGTTPTPPGDAMKGTPLYQSLHPKCANPACPTQFNWTGGGKFFRFRIEEASDTGGSDHMISPAGAHAVRHYWLCEQCCHAFTLRYDDGSGVVVKLLWTELSGAASDQQSAANV